MLDVALSSRSVKNSFTTKTIENARTFCAGVFLNYQKRDYRCIHDNRTTCGIFGKQRDIRGESALFGFGPDIMGANLTQRPDLLDFAAFSMLLTEAGKISPWKIATSRLHHGKIPGYRRCRFYWFQHR